MGDHGIGANHGDKALQVSWVGQSLLSRRKLKISKNDLQAPGMTVATPSVPSNDSYFALAEVML